MEKWSPYEISVFEAAITLYGKNFSKIQKFVQSKNVKQVLGADTRTSSLSSASPTPNTFCALGD
jgi:hypothetical protein